MLVVGFIVANLICLPFAYVAAILNKVRLIRKYNHVERHPLAMTADLISFVIAGFFYLLLVQFKDVYYFYLHLFLVRKNVKGQSETLTYLDL